MITIVTGLLAACLIVLLGLLVMSIIEVERRKP